MNCPGKANIADALSRLNSSRQLDTGKEFDWVRAIAENSVPAALTPKEIEQASYDDEELNLVKIRVRSGNWSQCTVPSYLHVKDELYVYRELLLRGTRIVVPRILRDLVMKIAHEGHQGVVKTKNRLRSKVWWPKMDSDVEKLCKVCHGCQVVLGYGPPEPMSRVVPPSGPWQDYSADLMGPLPSGESILVVVDYYSRFYEVAILRKTTSADVIKAISPMFTRFGIPYSLRTDNGPQFVSDEFEKFLAANGIEHRKTTLLWPQANGEVEGQNRSLLKCLQIAQVEGKDWRTELSKSLMAYRSTPQATTGTTAFFMMFGREMRSKLPELRRETTDVTREEVRDMDWSSKLSGKVYSASKRGVVSKSVEVGDNVLLKVAKTNKLSPNFHPSPFKVVNKEREQVTVRDDSGVERKHNTSFAKKYNEQDGPSPVELPVGDKMDHADGELEESKEENSKHTRAPTVPAQEPIVRARPSRVIKSPSRFDDFVLS